MASNFERNPLRVSFVAQGAPHLCSVAALGIFHEREITLVYQARSHRNVLIPSAARNLLSSWSCGYPTLVPRHGSL
jgi:hypothetical protein